MIYCDFVLSVFWSSIMKIKALVQSLYQVEKKKKKEWWGLIYFRGYFRVNVTDTQNSWDL